MSHKNLPAAQDDFKQMKGIGPKTERRLHQAGILSYEQLAQSDPATLAEIVEGLVGMSAERIVQEDWRGQAHNLAQSRKAPANGQHYATFTVELLLGPNNDVRRTRVVHVQDEAHKETWAGWEDRRLVRFISRHAGLDAGPEVERGDDVGETAVPTPSRSRQQPKRQPAAANRPRMKTEPVDEILMKFAKPPQTHKPQPPKESRPVVSVIPKEVEPESVVAIAGTQSVFEHGRSFDVNVQLNLSHLEHNKNVPLSYQTFVFAVDIRAGTREEIGTVRGSVTEINDDLAIRLPAQIRLPGTYRLEAETNIAWLAPASDLRTAAKGTLVHIY